MKFCSPFAAFCAVDALQRFIGLERGQQAITLRHLFGYSSLAGQMFELACHELMVDEFDREYDMKIMTMGKSTDKSTSTIITRSHNKEGARSSTEASGSVKEAVRLD